jgi:hypothetical protein
MHGLAVMDGIDRLPYGAKLFMATCTAQWKSQWLSALLVELQNFIQRLRLRCVSWEIRTQAC